MSPDALGSYCSNNSNTKWTPTVGLRPLQQSDIGALQHLHHALFPINYDISFFNMATSGDGSILGFAAVIPQALAPAHYPDDTTVFVGHEQLVGFITAKELKLKDIPSFDRQLLNLGGGAHDDATIMYILTLGVVDAFRKQGIARRLVEHVESYAAKAGCLASYLHVITYNNNANIFYERSGFECIARVPDFYFIQTGRALYPDVTNYDAFIFMKKVPKLPTTVSSAFSSSNPLSFLWNQFTKVCLPFGGNPRRKLPKERKDAAPAWLRGLFGTSPSAATVGGNNEVVTGGNSMHIA